MLLKLVAGNMLAGLAAALFAWPAIAALAEKYTLFWIVMPFVLQAVLLIYDYALSLLIQRYMGRIRK